MCVCLCNVVNICTFELRLKNGVCVSALFGMGHINNIIVVLCYIHINSYNNIMLLCMAVHDPSTMFIINAGVVHITELYTSIPFTMTCTCMLVAYAYC